MTKDSFEGFARGVDRNRVKSYELKVESDRAYKQEQDLVIKVNELTREVNALRHEMNHLSSHSHWHGVDSVCAICEAIREQ